MKKWLLTFAGGALATIFGLMAIPAPKTYPETLIITKSVHKDDFSGYFVAERYTETLYRNEGKRAYNFVYIVNEDPEDLAEGDLIAVIMDENGTSAIADDLVIDYRYVGTRF